MTVIIKKWQISIALTFLALNVIVGLSFGVTWKVALVRGLTWSIVFLFTLILFTQFLLGLIAQIAEQQQADSLVDITLPPEEGVKQASFSNRQIDDDIEEMVRNNPERVAELTRKMGLD